MNRKASQNILCIHRIHLTLVFSEVDKVYSKRQTQSNPVSQEQVSETTVGTDSPDWIAEDWKKSR